MPSWKLVSALAMAASFLAVDARPASIPTSITPEMSNREAAAILYSKSVKSAAASDGILQERSNQARWVALGPNFKLPGRSNTVAVAVESPKATSTPVNVKSVASRMMKRVKEVVNSHKLVSRSEQETALEEAIESAKEMVRRATVAASTSDSCEAETSATCAVTMDCASQSIPANSHHYCGNKQCTWKCNTGYSVSGSGCARTAQSTPAFTRCRVTADCAGRTLPANAHAYCLQESKTCGFQCNKGYSVSGSGCVKTVATTTTKASTTTSRPASTQSPNSNIGILSQWKQKSAFFSKTSFMQNMDFTKFSWGDANTAIVQGVPASSWAAGIEPDSDSAVQVMYPAGSRNPSAKPVGGFGFYSDPLNVAPANNVSLSYSVFFPKDFDFVKGGKLPGLYGGKNSCSGGALAEDCFSARLMFRTGGMGEVYLYAPREKQTKETCTLGPLSYCNTVDGMSIGRGSWTFKPGQWTNIRQDIWLNTPGKADGGFNIWVNGQLALHADTVYYRNSAVGGVVTNGTVTNMTLIDYDNLPDNITIPNGGFESDPTKPNGGNPDLPFTLPLVTKVIVPPTSAGAQPTQNVWVNAQGETKTARWPDRDISAMLHSQNDLYNKRTKIVLDAAPRPTITSPPRLQAGIVETEDEPQELEKRAVTSVTLTRFSGIMFHTFFGGSSAAWNSPKKQYSYFKGVSVAINGPKK